MAEFQETLNAFNRMHRVFERDCRSCPMTGTNIGQCRKLLLERPDIYEFIVMEWAARNPEPRYPTWEEWQKENFPNADRHMCPKIFQSSKSLNCIEFQCYECTARPIPPEIAKKLGIKPK